MSVAIQVRGPLFAHVRIAVLLWWLASSSPCIGFSISPICTRTRPRTPQKTMSYSGLASTCKRTRTRTFTCTSRHCHPTEKDEGPLASSTMIVVFGRPGAGYVTLLVPTTSCTCTYTSTYCSNTSTPTTTACTCDIAMDPRS